MNPRLLSYLHVGFLLVAFTFVGSVSGQTISLHVDATEASRSILRSTLKIPVKPGSLTLFFPKWIPGEHTPTGPINDLVGLKLTAAGKSIPWRRDDIEMFAFHCEIPNGVTELDVSFDDVSQPESTMSAKLARIKWNRVVVYPEGVNSDSIRVRASLTLPDNWKYATALPVLNEKRSEIEFKEVSLTELVDSPAIIGANFQKFPLQSSSPTHEIDAMADTLSALEMKPETSQALNRLVAEASALFGAHHYRSYRFLLTLSDHGGSEGLEHHESSEDGVGENAFKDELELLDFGDLMAHEFVHSWNGKYRRPIGLATPDFEQPMKGDLLWVYEGLTQYLGHVLPSRSGLWTAEDFRESLALIVADFELQAGRQWRPLVDTAVAVQLTYPSPRAWMNYRRRVDYYDEGSLIWLDADILIRQQSGGKFSLNDFCRRFHGGQDTPPMLRPYSFDEVVNTLNDVTPYDWRSFLNERLNLVAPRSTLEAISKGGWRLVYNDKPNTMVRVADHARKSVDLSYSIGAMLKDDGTVLDVNPSLEAFKAGLGPGMKIVTVNGRSWSIDALRDALAAAKKNTFAIQLVVENGSFTQTIQLNYHGGERFPHLERDPSKPDVISEITKPLTTAR